VSSISINTAAGQATSITGLASGFDTSAIIKALVEAERVPITHLTTQQEKLQAQREQLGSLQTTLQQLSFQLAEFSLPSLFESSQTVTSSEPQRVSATVTSGAGIGGHQIEVTQLADSAQRTFTFTSPKAEETVKIDGHEFKLAANATAQELAHEINANSGATVYAAVLNSGTIVFSTRTTGVTGAEFIKVEGGALVEQAGSAREGQNAKYSVDNVSGESTTNTVTEAIPGVTLTLEGLTTKSGPVAIDVQAPALDSSAVEAQVQAFVKSYNATVEALEKQITTKPIAGASNAKEYAVGTLFGDTQLQGLLGSMRETIDEAVAGVPAQVASPFEVGISTGAPTGGSSSQASLEGQLALEPKKLLSALAENPEGVKTMLVSWSAKLQKIVDAASAPGGQLETRINGDESQITSLKTRITTMNEMLEVRQKALVQTYAQMESALAQSNAQLSWLGQQTERLSKGG
jgi:flagellar hook-associated protein 2